MTTSHFYSVVERYLSLELEQATRPSQRTELRLMKHRQMLLDEFRRIQQRRQLAQSPPM